VEDWVVEDKPWDNKAVHFCCRYNLGKPLLSEPRRFQHVSCCHTSNLKAKREFYSITDLNPLK